MKAVTQQKRLFLSLKWKAFLLTSLILSVIFGGLTFSNHYYLEQQFETKRTEIHQRHSQEIQGLIRQSAQRIQQLAGTVISIHGMADAVEKKDSAGVNDSFDAYWWQLQLDSGIDSAAIFTEELETLGKWGVPNIPDSLIKDTQNQERPNWIVNCWLTCEIYVAVPMLVDGRKGGIAVFGAPLLDVILDFKMFAGVDAGIVVSIDQHEVMSERYLPDWNVDVVAITQPERSLSIINRVANKYDMLFLERDSVLEHTKNRQTDEVVAVSDVKLLPLSVFSQLNKGFLITISDVTEDVKKLGNAKQESKLLGGGGLLVAEMLMLFILWRPMSRLRYTALYLPLLAQNSFEKVRESLSKQSKDTLFQDESDILNNTAIALSHQLEGLQVQLHRRAEQLQERGRELEAERDFVTGLLNTAHALILTQDEDGNILMINRHGEWITGYTEDELVGGSFTNILPRNALLPDLSHQLEDLIIGKRSELHHEADLVTKDGESLHIAWYHSSLSDKGQRHKILTIGLDISERKQAEDNLGWLASHDSLTGLINRRRFSEDLERVIETNQRYDRVSALLFFDLDQFKDVNDTSGHHIGDMLLKRVSEVLKNTARESDIIARLGGDEFATIVQEIDLDQLGQTADRFCKALTMIEVSGANQIHRVSSSIGVAIIPKHGKNVEEVLANADIAMYQAKESGRNCWHIFDDREHGKERVHERVYWNEKVKQALNEDDFTTYFQPIACVKTGKVSYYESLLRIFDENHRPYPASKLVSAAERSGLIQEMDERVIEKVIAQKANLEIRGIDARLSINVSGLSFRNVNLLGHIKKCLTQLDVNPHSIIFEITETAAVADIGATSEIIRGIKEMGCKFALDDFGVGFSSLYYLKQLPIDYIKIDGSFIRHLHDEPDDQVLVRALVEVAKAFGQYTVAEFVEHKETLDLLKEIGVDFAQGHYIAHPKPVDEIWS